MPKTIKVKLAEVRNHLPDDTPTIDRPTREAAIRLRRKGWQMRKHW